jgi:Histidinol phosphatase and related hydrolases of the PHP family
MKYILDTHTHTVASGHAYGTIREMAKAASEKKLELIGITEHAPMMPGTCHEFYFQNLKVVDRELYGVELLLGVELNILNYSGQVDLSQKILQHMDIVIASLHVPCIRSGTAEENTAAYLHAMKNPCIDIIGHPDDSRYEVDYQALVLGAKEHGVLLELNNSSLVPGGVRQNPEDNDIQMLKYCRQYNVPIVMGSDAHFDTCVGRHDLALKLVQEIDFPEELILNKSVSELKRYVNKYKTK